MYEAPATYGLAVMEGLFHAWLGPIAWPDQQAWRHERGSVDGAIGKTLQGNRLDPMRLAVVVDEGDHGLNRRSSCAWAK